MNTYNEETSTHTVNTGASSVYGLIPNFTFSLFILICIQLHSSITLFNIVWQCNCCIIPFFKSVVIFFFNRVNSSPTRVTAPSYRLSPQNDTSPNGTHQKVTGAQCCRERDRFLSMPPLTHNFLSGAQLN